MSTNGAVETPQAVKPSQDTIIRTLMGQLQQLNDNRYYLMAVAEELSQENDRLKLEVARLRDEQTEETLQS